MQVSFLNHIKWSNSDKINNFFEEYCAVLPELLGKTVKHYQQIDSQKVVPCTAPQKNNWQDTAKKVLIAISHLTFVVPLIMYVGKAICRKVTPLQIVPPAVLNPHNHKHLAVAEEIRKLREDSNYIPKECQSPRIPLRFKMPVDSILVEMDPSLKPDPQSPFPIIFPKNAFQSLDTELKQKQQQILAEGFNGFHCVHGIENAKGGIKNLLNAMLEGVLRAPYTGGLLDGMPEYVAGPHGPYYVILDGSLINLNNVYQRKGLWSEDAQVAYLVPQESDRKFLEEGLNKAVERGYITEEEKIRALKKVITYDEFIQLSSSIRHSEALLRLHLKNKY